MKTVRAMSWMMVAALGLVGLLAPPALADDDESERRVHRSKKIIKGLEHGLEALKELGGHQELARRMHRLLMELRAEKQAGKERGKKRGKNHGKSEREVAEGWLKSLHVAHDVLMEADREEHAKFIRHARDALSLALKGRKDEEAMQVRKSAPSRARQAKSLFLAAEILADQGKQDWAHRLAELGKRFQGKAKRKEDEDEDEEEREEPNEERRAYLEGLKRRVETMRTAMTAFREGERKDLMEKMERAIHTGELLLAGREDEEAQAIYEQTPSLGMLAELLGHAAHLWTKFGHEKEAGSCKELSQYYGQRWRAQQEERKAAETREREEEEEAHRERDGERDYDGEHGKREREDDHAGRERGEARKHKRERERAQRMDQIQELQAQLQKMLHQLERMQKALNRLRER